MPDKHKTTPIGALATFYAMRETYFSFVWETSCDKARYIQERRTTWDMLMVLTEAVLGPRTSHQLPFLCDVCMSCYAQHDVQEHGKKWSTYCCPECVQALRTAGRIAIGNGEPI